MPIGEWTKFKFPKNQQTTTQYKFKSSSDVHTHNILNIYDFHGQQHRSMAFEKFLSEVGFHFINKLPKELKEPMEVKVFKKKTEAVVESQSGGVSYSHFIYKFYFTFKWLHVILF